MGGGVSKRRAAYVKRQVGERVAAAGESAAESAARWAKEDEEAWRQDRADFEAQWQRMLCKRERRFGWYIRHGSVPDGWTPPDPSDPHSRKYPKRALAARLPKKYRALWPVLLDRSECELMADTA